MRAEIVNAIIEPVASIIRSYVGEEPCMEIGVTSEIEEAPWLSVTIDLHGHLVGPVTCIVSEGLARLIAAKMAPMEDINPELCQEAVGELANIITGNATGKLVEAGYQVEIAPPRRIPSEAHTLTRQTLSITLETAAGTIKVLLGLRIHAPGA